MPGLHAPADLLARRAAARDGARLPGADEPVRAADAGLVDHLADLGRGADRHRQLVQSDTYRGFEIYIIVAVVYLALSLLMRAGLLGDRPACCSRAAAGSARRCEDVAVIQLNANHLMFLLERRAVDDRPVADRLRRRRLSSASSSRCARLAASGRCARSPAGYIQLIQGTPLLVILFLSYFGLPASGLQVSPAGRRRRFADGLCRGLSWARSGAAASSRCRSTQWEASDASASTASSRCLR